MASSSAGTGVKKKVSRRRMKQPPLLKQLKGILSEYPDGGQILKELIQNAEDAGAYEVKFMFDKRRINDQCATDSYSRFFKGPALCVYNDAVFTEQDWDGIQMIYSSVKEDDPLKVGRFGLGFKSVFHITDFPCVLSGDKLLLIDPQLDEINPENVNSTFELKSLDEYDEDGFEPDSFWQAFDNIFGLQKESVQKNGFQGTIFWFPLRENASPLSETLYNEGKVMDLFDALHSEASNVLIFLKNVEKISLHIRSEDDTMKESMRVEIKDSDNAVRNARRLFKERISSLSPGYNGEDIYNSMPMTIHTVSESNEESNTWLVVNYFVGESASDKFRNLSKDSNLGYSPYVGVAAPLCETNENFEGNVFCFLPLPREGERLTGLPVHVNGFFALSQNRHHMKWETEEQHGKKIDDKSILWNMALIEEALPRAYEIIVLEAINISTNQANTNAAVRYVYNMLPVREKENEQRRSYRRWILLEEELYKRLQGKNILFCEHLNKWIPVEKGCFATFRSVKPVNTCDEILKHAVVKCLRSIGKSYVEVSENMFESLQKYFRDVQDLTPVLLAKYLRDNTGYKSLGNSEKLAVLKFLIQNECVLDILTDLELLPLSSGNWTNFGQHYGDVFLCSDEAVGMFPGLEQEIVMKSAELGDALAEWMKKVCKSGRFQIKRIDAANAKKLLKKTMEKHVGSSTKVTLSKHSSLTLKWLQHTWHVLVDKKLIQEFAEIPLIPVLEGGRWEDPVAIKLSPMSDMQIAKTFQGRSISEDICSCLEVMSVTIIPSLPAWIPDDIIKQYVHMPDESGVLGVFGKVAHLNCEKAVTDFNRSCNEQKAKAMIDLLRDLNMDRDSIKLLSRLDMFKCTKTMHGEYRLASVHRNPRYMIKVPDFPPEVQFVSECIIITEREETLLKKLGGEKIQLEAITTEILQGMQHMTRYGEMERLMSYFMKNFYLFEQRQDICRLASNLAFLKAGSDMRKPSELYDPTDIFLQDLLLGEGLFPDNADTSKVRELRVLGLKDKRDIDCNVMLSVAKRLDQWSKESNNSENICKKAHAFKEILQEKPELLQGNCSMSGKALCVSIRDLRCIPVRKEKLSDYPDRLEWFSESLLLCSPGDAKNCNLGLVVGAIMPVVEFASQKLSTIFKWNENPEIKTVIQQLAKCRQYYQQQVKCDFAFCAYIQKLYIHMFNRVKEIQNLPVHLKNEIFVWTGDSFEIPSKVIIDLQDKVLDLRPYFYSLPDEFSDITPLFQCIGCKASVDPALLINVLNQIKENNTLQLDIQQTVSRDIQIVLQVLKKLSAKKQKGEDVIKDDILMLTNEGVGCINLRPGSLCIFEDDEDELDHDEIGKMYTVHENVPHDVALNLGVRSLEKKTIHDASEDLDFEEWGQSEPLTTRINSLLREGYKDGLSVPKELVQNADDAGATVVKFLYDERRNLDARKKLLTKKLSECQGPALWVYNDSVFTENDLKNITKLNGATKADSEDKIGKFGLGFCSVYNLTDVPSFVSGNDMIIFDPHESYIEEARKKRGTGLRITLSKRNLIRRNIEQFKPYNSIFDCTLTDTNFNGYKGTLFRLPLRTEAQAQESQISKEEYSKAKVIELLTKFEENAGNIILFTQNVKAIELYHLPNSETDPRNAKLIFELRKNITTMSGEATATVLKRIPAIIRSSVQFNELHTVNISLKIKDGLLLDIRETTKAEFKSSWIISWALGRKGSKTLAKQLSGKGAVPLTSVAVPVVNATPIDLDKLGNGFYKEGHVFCFLPLPIQTGLCIHINGCFNVRSDRTGLVSFTEDDIKKDKISEWNPVLMQDSLVCSFVHLLQYLAAHSSPDYFYHMLWPLQVKEDIKHFQDGFVRSIFMEKPKLFRNQQEWLSVDEMFFLEPSVRSSSIGNTAFEVLSKVPVRPGKQIVEMPLKVLDLLMSCDFDKENILKSAIISEEEVLVHILETINHTVWDERADERNEVVLYAICSSNYTVSSKVKVTKCIPSEPNGVLCTPSKLIDPRSDIAKMFDSDEGFFPLQSSKFNEEKFIVKLIELGMLNKTIPHEMLLARCFTVQKLESKCSRCALERSLNVLKYVGQWNHLSDLERDKTALAELRNIKFVPVKPCPKTWKFTWGADNLPGNTATASCSSHFLPSESIDAIKFERPVVLCRESNFSCLGSVCEFADESLIKKKCCPAEKIYSVLAVKSEMTVELLVNQLELLPEQYTNEETQYTNLEKIIRDVYDNIARLIQDKPEEEICKMACFLNKQKLRIVLKGRSLIAPENMAFNVKSECSSGLFRLEVSDYYKRKVFKALGVAEHFSVEYIITLFQGMKNKWSNNVCNDIETITKLISNLCDSLMREHKTYQDIDAFCEGIVAPDTRGFLRPTHELVIEDPAFEAFTDFHILHGSVPANEGKVLGVKSKQRKIVEGFSSQFFMPFGQNESLVTRLTGILEDYPCDSSIMKELIQNADDAGASEIHFIKNYDTYSSKTLFGKKELQGPSLCIFNDSSFTDEDFDGIRHLGIGSKREDPSKTGQYGIGFNAVYHLTDVPSFLTKGANLGLKGQLCFFDPLQEFLDEGYITRENPGIRCDVEKMARTFPEMLLGYPNCDHFEQGTMFRLPLRQRCSEISKNVLDVHKMDTLLESFKKDMFESLFFLKNLKCIKILRVQKGEVKEEYAVRVRLSTEETELRNSFFKEVKTVVQNNKDHRHLNLTVQPIESSYIMHVEDSNNRSEKWRLTNRFGIGNLKDKYSSITNELRSKTIGLMPLAAVAVQLPDTNLKGSWDSRSRKVGDSKESNTCKNGRAFCFLPLPIKTGMPLHVNGHFALDKARSKLWDEGVRKTWNEFVISELLCRCWISALKFLKQDFVDKEVATSYSRTSDNSLALLLNAYHDFFPVMNRATDSFWKCLVVGFYQLVIHEQIKIFPCLQTNAHESTTGEIRQVNTIEWVPLSKSENDFSGYFNGIYKTVVNKKEFDQKAGKSVEITLKKLGMKVIETPKEIRHSLEESDIKYIPLCVPNAVIVFLKSFSDSSETSCKLGTIGASLTDTKFSSTEALANLVRFLLTEKKFSEQIEGVPLCLTADGRLRIFQKNRTTYCSQMSNILTGSVEKFLHADLCWLMDKDEFFVSGILNRFTVQSFLEEIPRTFSPHQFAANAMLLWNKQEEIPCPVLSIQHIFLYIYCESLNENGVMDRELFKNHLQKMKLWSFLPAVTMFGQQQTFQLMPISFSSRLFHRGCFGNEMINEVLDKLNLPTLDTSVFADSGHCLIYPLQELLPSTAQPVELLNCLIHYVSKIRSSSLTCAEGLRLLGYFDSNLKRMTKIENNAFLQSKLKELPLYVSQQQELIDLVGKTNVIVFNKGMPTNGIREWAERTGIILLEQTYTLSDLFKFLNVSHMSEIEVYIYHVLPNIQYLPKENWIEHVKYIKSKFPDTSQQTSEQSILVQLLKNLAFIQINGVDKQVQELYDRSNPVFSHMLDEDCFLPQEFETQEWKTFMEMLGLIREPSDEMMINFALAIEKHCHLPISENIKQKSEAIVNCLFHGTWDGKTLSRIKDVRFVVPYQLDPIKHNVFHQPNGGTMLISLDGAVSCEFEDLCWSTTNLLDKVPNELLMKELRIYEKPETRKVVQHCQNICDILKRKLEDKSVPIAFVKALMENLYRFLSENFESSMKQQFQATPIVFLPEDEIMVTVHKVVINAVDGEEIKPFLFRLANCFGPFDKFFVNIGATACVQCTHYAMVLEDVWSKFQGETLPPNMLFVVKKAIENLVRLLEKEGFKSFETVKQLYLPDQTKKLVKSTTLTVSNNDDIQKRLKGNLDLNYFVGFRALEITTVRDPVLPFLSLPVPLRPEILTRVIVEKVSDNDIRTEYSQEAQKIESFIRSPQLVEGILRLVKHQLNVNEQLFVDQTEKRIMNNISNVKLTKVTGLITYLTYKENRINGTDREAVCFVKTEKTDDEELKIELYFQCDQSENVLERLIQENHGLTRVIDICTGNILQKDMCRHAISILHCFENPSEIRTKLDKLFIDAYNLPQEYFSSVFPSPGTYVEEKFYPFLQHALLRFKVHEFRFVAYEIEEVNEHGNSGMDVDQQDTEENQSNDPELLYMYAHIIEEVHREENVSDVLATYRIDVGCRSKEPVTVPIYRLYKFVPKEQEIVNALEVYDIEPIGAIPIDENFRRVRKTLVEAWSSGLDEKSRRHVIRRLQMRWHPDRNRGHQEYASRLFNYIGEIVLMLERGDLITEETNDDTGKTEPNMSGSSYCGIRSSASKRGTIYARAFYEDMDDYNRSTRSGRYAHCGSEVSVVRHVGEAKRWLKQAQQDFIAAKTNLSTADHDQSYNWVCYKCHQAAEKALKASWFSKNANRATTKDHSLSSLARELDNGSFLEKSHELEQIIGDYFKLRYPDAFSDRQAIPSERITEDQANDSLKVTKEILDMARDFIA